MKQARVLDAEGKSLSPCSMGRAQRVVAACRARVVAAEPFTIQLTYAVSGEPRAKQPAITRSGQGKKLLLHICCAPCSTYCIKRLRELGFGLTGSWYNPNIHPAEEYEKRGDCLHTYAAQVDLPMIWPASSDSERYWRAVAGCQERPQRCIVCYRLRLEETARVAHERGFDGFTTTLLISPYQQQNVLRAIGGELARQYGVEFFYENLRRGWAERGRMAREYGLYMQRYCGCAYSEQEASDARARSNRHMAAASGGVLG